MLLGFTFTHILLNSPSIETEGLFQSSCRRFYPDVLVAESLKWLRCEGTCYKPQNKGEQMSRDDKEMLMFEGSLCSNLCCVSSHVVVVEERQNNMKWHVVHCARFSVCFDCVWALFVLFFMFLWSCMSAEWWFHSINKCIILFQAHRLSMSTW